MIKEICIVGHPSKLGGADTELDHQIHIWQKMDIKVHICHTGPIDNNLKNMKMQDRGCIYHNSNDWKSLTGFHVISFCNGRFLQLLQEIRKFAKTTTFVNCMTWNFAKEIDCQRRGLIDFHLYQSDHGLEMVSQKLKGLGKPYRPIRIQPYFHCFDFPYIKDRPENIFKFGRISRGDADKYSDKQLWIYEQFSSPVPKEGIILGWDNRAKRKFGGQDPKIPHLKVYPEGGITQQEFYRHTDVLIMATKTFENLPRVGFEAMSSGSVLIVDNRGGWKVQVDHGKTGYLCNNESEFVMYSAQLAKNKNLRDELRENAHNKLLNEWGEEASIKSWENVFNQWEKLR